MNRMPSIPPLRDLPPSRFEAHRAHLFAEIGRQPQRRRRPAIRWTSLRVAFVAGASAVAAAAVAAAVATGWGGGSTRQPTLSTVAAPALVYVSHVAPARPSKGDDLYLPSGLTSATAPVSLTADFRFRGVRVPILVYVLARHEAADNGDRHPASVQWVKTTRQLAVSSQSSDRVGSPHRSVYFVVLHGHFVDKNAYYIGRAGDAPHGSVLSLTIDRRNGQILDVALGYHNPDYARLGAVHQFRFEQGKGTK